MNIADFGLFSVLNC